MLGSGALLALAAALVLGACAAGTGESRCLQRIEGAYGYQGRWVRCPPGSPVVLPDDY